MWAFEVSDADEAQGDSGSVADTQARLVPSQENRHVWNRGPDPLDHPLHHPHQRFRELCLVRLWVFCAGRHHPAAGHPLRLG